MSESNLKVLVQEGLISMLYGLAMVLIILCLVYYTGVVAQTNLGQTKREPNSNNITLQCKDEHDEDIADAIFYRNGASLMDDSCFVGSTVNDDGSMLTINISPTCEGYYSCGRAGATVISAPVKIYGKNKCMLCE